MSYVTHPRRAVLLTSGHRADDERIYHKIGKSLLKSGLEVTIISSRSRAIPDDAEISFDCFHSGPGRQFKNIRTIRKKLFYWNPELIICSEIMPILPAILFKICRGGNPRVLYDVTEWYPEKSLRHMRGVKRAVMFIAHHIFILLLYQFVDAFISGEKGKLAFAGLWVPQKPQGIVEYYPAVTKAELIQRQGPPGSFSVFFAGTFNDERGFFFLVQALIQTASLNPAKKIIALMIGEFESETDKESFHSIITQAPPNLSWVMPGRLPYYDYLTKLEEADVCVDSRLPSSKHHKSLPIKVFDYLSWGKPVIYTELSALKKQVNLEYAGFFIREYSVPELTALLIRYLNDRDLLMQHSANAIALASGKYNWEIAEKHLIGFLNTLA